MHYQLSCYDVYCMTANTCACMYTTSSVPRELWYPWWDRKKFMLSDDISRSLTKLSAAAMFGVRVAPDVSTLRPRQNGRQCPEDYFKCIYLKENVHISIQISLKSVSKCPINNIPALFQIIGMVSAWRQAISELMMVNLLTHICVTRPAKYWDFLVVAAGSKTLFVRIFFDDR